MSVCIFCGSPIRPTDGYFMGDGEHEHRIHDSCLRLMLATAFAEGGLPWQTADALSLVPQVQP